MPPLKKEATIKYNTIPREVDYRTCEAGDSCIFGGLDGENHPCITLALHRVLFATGENIIHQGAPRLGYYVFCHGSAELFARTRSGKKVLFKFCRPGELLGAADSEVHNISVTALEPSLMRFVDTSYFSALLVRYPAMAPKVVALLSKDITNLRQRLEDIVHRNVRQRLVVTLLELAMEYGTETSTGLLINRRLTHQQLAEIVGSTRQTVNQELQALAQKDLIAFTKSKIRIIDKISLKEAA